MSSEEEMDDENGEVVFVVRPLKWQSDELKFAKKILDDKWLSIQTERSKRTTIKRVVATFSDNTTPPASIPEQDRWILKNP